MKKIFYFIPIFFLCFVLVACISKPKTYVITYHLNNETNTITKEYQKSEAISSSFFDASLDGFEPIGWYHDEAFVNEVVFPYKVTKNEDFYLKWETKTLTITFINEEDEKQTQIPYNTKAEQPTTPSKEGYTFKGWSTNSTTYTAWNFDTPITNDLTLYAFFEEQSFTVIFIVDQLSSKEIVSYGNTITKANPTKEGYTFKGWSTKENEYHTFDTNTKITKDMTLYAFFEIKTFTVSFINGTDVLTTASIQYNSKVEKPNNPSIIGFKFINWYQDETFTKLFDFTTPIIKDTIIYGKFEPVHTHTITLSIDGVESTKLVNDGECIKLDTPVKTGYTFKNWNLNGSIFNLNTPITQDLHLIAVFKINTYKITFKNDSITNVISAEYQTTIQEPVKPTKEGYTFDGWYNGLIKFDFRTPITKDIILIAKYTPNTYIVTFKNGTDIETVLVEQGKLVEEPTQPIKEGFSFLGWFENDIKFDFNTPIESDITLTAKFEESILNITSSAGYNEGLFIEFEKLNQVALADYSISYKSSLSTTYLPVDKELIREKGNHIRCDIVGLPKGTYDVQIAVEGKTVHQSFKVSEDDRSGYAHFGNTSGIGAYKNDGSLKSNAVVVYVSDQTKNTVTTKIGSKTYTGLANIIKACTSASYALDIRILGEIQTTQWNKKTHGTGNTAARQTNLENTFKYTTDSSGWDEGSSSNYSKLNEKEIISKGINSMSEDLAKGITQLNGLTNQVLRSKKASSSKIYEYDSYYNMLDVVSGQNITIEGIGTDASIFQWGFTFKKSDSIEVKNLRFYNYTEDAVGFEGSSSDINHGNYWIHNCTFDLGVNHWDVCYEADKGDGDGSTDVKYCHNVTISYTQYNSTHKTNLIGSGDSALQYNITLHHNYYNKAGSRLPLVRQANIHIYNNYYYGSTGYSHSIRANCYAFVENNYYDGGKNPYELVSGGVIKSYNNIYNNVSTSGNYKKGNTVTSRTQTVSSTCKPDGKTDYSNFDTNAKLFYYNQEGYSDVQILLDTNTIPDFCKTYAGVLKANAKGLPESSTGGSQTPDPILPPTEEDITWENVVTLDFSSTISIPQIEYSLTAPTTIGFSYSFNSTSTDTGSTTTNYMKVENGMLKVIDTSKVSTFGYYIFDQVYQSGKVRISLDFIPQKSSGSWTMIHFLDGNTNLGIRTNSDKVLGYTTDGSTITPIATKAMEANKTYSIVLIIDYDTGTASIEINGEKIALSYTNAIKGIMFQTANADTARSFSIDNIKIDIAN